ncbi:MAG: transketolase, partial [Ghiorsea sp.]|nr:transketolase [Ghiorsea sp.]
LAGTLGLGKLIAFWDDNGISIDGEVEGWFTDDTAKRFEAYGWQVIRDVDGHDADEIKQAIETAKSELGKPTMICCKTIIGFGSPNKAGSHDCHGAALGDEEIALVRKELNWESPPFEIPADVYKGWDNKEAGKSAESEWDKTFAAYAAEYPTEAAEFTRRINGDLTAEWESTIDAFIAETAAKGEFIASRKASQNTIEVLAKVTPEFLGGSADLAGSNLTLWSGAKPVIDHADGNYVNYGVREFGMAAMINGISLHGGFVPYGATFLMFSEYARNALRMAALMKTGHIEVFTHDSIGLGEDGPTHQPVEQTATLRMIPNMDVWRPCDAVETAVAWKVAVKNTTRPTSLIFSRQNLVHQERTADQMKLIERGGYILKDCEGTPDVIVIGTGSELNLAVEAAAASDKKVRVVSMPSTNVFDEQDAAYKESVLPKSIASRVAVEAGVTGFWAKYVGLNGKVIGIDT